MGIISLRGRFGVIAGYTPATDVTNHAAVDQDLEEILTLLTTSDDGDDPSDYTAAYLQYKNGSHSTKSSSRGAGVCCRSALR